MSVEPFDICGPLPTGMRVLEASAGTGKTYTIAGLAARYVAEGTPLEQLLLITFTRMATGELRERVRERLVAVERGLAGAEHRDEVVTLLAGAPAEEVARRRRNLIRAIADFDAATIATTHSFCQEVLGGLGVAGDVEREMTFIEDPADLVEEIVDDLYVGRFHGGDTPPFGRAEAGQIARVVVGNPAAPLAPAAGEVPQRRRSLAKLIRGELRERKRRLSVMTYDDLLTLLDNTLAGASGPAVCAKLRDRYSVVLVDEFQDTDPVQWDIVQRAFGGNGTTLVLIGDPKQAIYAFRGADVYAYIRAKEVATTTRTLEINWRSDQGLIDAYDAMFGGAKLGHEGIVYRQVRAADANQTPRLSGAPEAAALRVRVARRSEPTISVTGKGYARNASAREHIAKDLAADVVRLLDSGASIERRSDTGEPRGTLTVCPGHVAVLVRKNWQAALIRDELEAVGVPAVINGAGSVFETGPAQEWLRLLEALERPTSRTRAHSAALTCFFGWSAERVAGAEDDEWEAVHSRLHDWARVLRVQGVASLMETITLVERLPERILTIVDGERWMTDLRHVAQLLHAEASAEQLGVTALTGWLRRRIADAARDTHDEERSRRLESDEEAVQVLTIHRSKGLEFPIVYYPFLWEGGYPPRKPAPVVFHDAAAGDERTIDLALAGSDFYAHKQLQLEEERGEDLRLAYVALTRAQHQAVLWWAGSFDSRNSSLSRLLFARDDDGNVHWKGSHVPTDDEAIECFETLAGDAPGCISVEHSTLGLPPHWGGLAREPADLAAADFDRGLDWLWRRTSYSDITAGRYEARVASEPEQAAVVDEPAGAEAPPAADDDVDAAIKAIPSLLADMPVGLEVGTLVHRVFERADFAAEDLDAELAAQIADAQAHRAVDLGDAGAAVTGLRAAVETPLGPLLGGVRLRDVEGADRLDELEFELPLAGGDEPTGRLTIAMIGDMLREHLPADDPLAGYADRLGDPALRQTVRGFMTGSLDLVVRVSGADGTPRFAVIDYKTNWLGGPDEPLTVWHHRPSALAAEMHRRHYGLQALLYTVALHRYLRWRIPDYDPDRHLAGVLYLFLRGMVGAETPLIGGCPCGVFSWRPSRDVVVALSDVLDRGGAA